jgi:hypothetical protein
MKYYAISNRQNKYNASLDYWVLLSKPCTKQEAEQFRGCEMRGEKFEIKTEEQVNNHKFVLR